MFGATHHSSKRRAEEEPESEQRMTKRLARMRIDQPPLQPIVRRSEPIPDGSSTGDLMYLDDTRDKVYIHDLESEIAQIEAEEPRGIFLPDIERKISAIPQQLLQSRNDNANTQMVLYHVPSSISVPEEQDHVRKAIIAARARARELQARKAEESEKIIEKHVHYQDHVNGLVPDGIREEQEEDDPDAMELG